MEVIVNYWAVLGAAVASIALGMLWYGPLFGKTWMGLMGFTPESMKAMKMTPMQVYIGGFITALLTAYVLAHVYTFASAYMGAGGVMAGLSSGFWSWLGFVATTTFGMVLWEGKSVKLWMIVSGYYLVSLLIMGAVIGYFS